MSILFFLLSITAQSHAHGVERGILSPELVERIKGAVYKNCNVREAFSVDVIDFTRRTQKVDQGIYDYFYEVTVKALTPSRNEEFIKESFIQVKAAEYSVSNPAIDPYEIVSVKSKSRICD